MGNSRVIQDYALRILREYGTGVMTTGRTGLIDRQPWIHWQTARALERRGLVRLVEIDDGYDIYSASPTPDAEEGNG